MFTICSPSAVSATMWMISVSWERLRWWSCVASSEETILNISKISEIGASILGRVTAAAESVEDAEVPLRQTGGCDIPFCSPGDTASLQEFP